MFLLVLSVCAALFVLMNLDALLEILAALLVLAFRIGCLILIVGALVACFLWR